MDVTVTRRYKGKQYDQISSRYTGGVGTAPAVPPLNAPPGETIITYPEPAIFYFVDDDMPTIREWSTLYFPTYGRYPRFILIVDQDSLEHDGSENELVQYMVPKMIVVDDVLISVEYDLTGLGPVSGKIIINK